MGESDTFVPSFDKFLALPWGIPILQLNVNLVLTEQTVSSV